MMYCGSTEMLWVDRGLFIQYKTHTHTHTHGSMNFVRDNPGEETFTHSHLSWSSIIVPYLLHPSNTIHGILPAADNLFFHNLQVFFDLPLGLAPSISCSSIHTFLHPVIVFFSQHMPIPLQPVLLRESSNQYRMHKCRYGCQCKPGVIG